MGARLALISQSHRAKAQEIAQQDGYIELAAVPNFVNCRATHCDLHLHQNRSKFHMLMMRDHPRNKDKGNSFSQNFISCSTKIVTVLYPTT
jgi:uncharacterized 2Fe-2S/4Fe-4S cluster protein (DUF4445 family)